MSIAIITSGGDAPGMNACIRAVVRTALKHNIQVVGFKSGYQGILEDDCEVLTRTSVSDIIQRGGTFLQTDTKAFESLVFSADNSLVYNASNTDVFIDYLDKKVVVLAGKTVKITD